MDNLGFNDSLLDNVTLLESYDATTTSPAIGRVIPLLKHSTLMVALLSIAYGVVFLLGVVNNSLVVAVIYKNPSMRHVTNYFIANLAIADMMVCIMVLPITLLSNLFTGK